jgi:hypothetical protein
MKKNIRRLNTKHIGETFITVTTKTIPFSYDLRKCDKFKPSGNENDIKMTLRQNERRLNSRILVTIRFRIFCLPVYSYLKT